MAWWCPQWGLWACTPVCCVRWTYSPASCSDNPWFPEFSKLVKVSSRSDTVLGVSVSELPAEVWQKFSQQSPGGSSSYADSGKPEGELQGLMGLTGRGTNCCGREYLITAGRKTHTAVRLFLPSQWLNKWLFTHCTWLDIRGQAVSQDGVEDGDRVDEEGVFWVHHGIITRQILKPRK